MADNQLTEYNRKYNSGQNDQELKVVWKSNPSEDSNKCLTEKVDLV